MERKEKEEKVREGCWVEKKKGGKKSVREGK